MAGTGDVVCSTGTMPDALGRRYHDLEAACAMAASIPVRAVELVLHPDWRPNIAPRSDQPDPPACSPFYSTRRLIERMDRLRREGGPRVRSVHANRDLGIFLGSPDPSDRRIGEDILVKAVKVAGGCAAKIVVVHLWDSWAGDTYIREAAAVLEDVSSVDSSVGISVENIPLNSPVRSQFATMQLLDRMLPEHIGFTLDLSWSSMYDNFREMVRLLPRLTNVHVQGRLRWGDSGIRLEPRSGNLNLESAVRSLCRRGYRGQWTLELNRPGSIADFRRALRYLSEIIR